MKSLQEINTADLAESKIYHKETSISDRVACDKFMDEQFEKKDDITDPNVRQSFEEVYSTALRKNFSSSKSGRKYFL